MWWNKKEPEKVVEAQPQPVILKPGDCECGHARCSHVGGIGICCAATGCYDKNDNPTPKETWGSCACQIYIRDDDDDDSDDETPPVEPEVA